MNNTQDTFGELRKSFDGSDPFMTQGHQIIKLREGNRKTPDWAKDKRKIQKTLLLAFPKLWTNAIQRQRAGRWVRVIYLYYNTNLTQSQVAAEMAAEGVEISPNTVKMILRAVRRKISGKTVNFQQRTGKPRGRPKNK